MTSKSENRMSALRSELEAELDPEQRPEEGSSLFPATVVGVNGSDVVVEIGPRAQGIVPLEEFDATPELGKALKLSLRGREDSVWLFSAREAKALAAWDTMEVGSLIKCTVVGLNKGGLELKVASMRAFMPASQVALNHVEDLSAFGGQTMVCEVIELDRDKKRVVVSRRSVLEAEKARQRDESVQGIQIGSVVKGRVARLETYGAFVDLGGVEGLLHVSNMAHRRVERPEEMVKVGEEVEVQILSIDEGGRRIGLGRKQLEADPWDDLDTRLREDQVVTGRIRRMTNFGAFVETEPGIEGLLHISQMSAGRIRHPNEAVKVGQEVQVRVINLNTGSRRLSLSQLDSTGAILGSDDAAAGAEVTAVLKEDPKLGTNLGALFKKALDSDA